MDTQAVAERLRERAETIGASYRAIAERVGVSYETIRKVLRSEESGLPINRIARLSEINWALDEIEAEEARKTASFEALARQVSEAKEQSS